MTSAILSRTTAAVVLFGEVLPGGCSATVTSQPVTDAGHAAIVERRAPGLSAHLPPPTRDGMIRITRS